MAAKAVCTTLTNGVGRSEKESMSRHACRRLSGIDLLWPCFERTVTERGTGSYFPSATRSFAGRIGQVVIKRTILKKRTNDLVIRPLRANSLIKPSTCVRAARLSRRAGAGGLVGGGKGF